MIFVFRSIIYDSKLIHKYNKLVPDFVKDLPIMDFAPDSFHVLVTREYCKYNYVYIPEYKRYYYFDVKEYKSNTVRCELTCDYGRTFAPVIETDFRIAEEDLEGTTLALLPSGEHIMAGDNILYLPSGNSDVIIPHNDAEKVIALLKSGLIINLDDYEADSYSLSSGETEAAPVAPVEH